MPCTHIEEDLLERYAIGTLSSELLPEIEEHLLLCSTCQNRLIEADQLVRAFRAAVVQLDARRVPFWKRIPAIRTVRWAGAVAAVAALLVVVIPNVPHNTNVLPATVMLESLRGPEAGASIAAGRPSRLVFDLNTPSTPDHYKVQILDLVGTEVLSPNVEMTNGQISVMAKNLSRGSYWVRLYRRDNNEMAAEYGLRVE